MDMMDLPDNNPEKFEYRKFYEKLTEEQMED